MRQPARARGPRDAAIGRALCPRGLRIVHHRGFLARRGFLGDADLEQDAVGIAEPEAVRLEAARRIELLDAMRLEARAELREVVLEHPERHVGELLLRPFDDRAPAMRVAVGIKREALPLRAQVEPERAVECLGLLQVGHRQVEMVDRVDPKLARPPGRPDEASDLRHAALLAPASRYCFSRCRWHTGARVVVSLDMDHEKMPDLSQ